jgi:DNA gyrase subunit A
MLITNGGTLVRTRVEDISVSGRSAMGVKLISLANDERLIGIERVEMLEGEVDNDSIESDGGEQNQNDISEE